LSNLVSAPHIGRPDRSKSARPAQTLDQNPGFVNVSNPYPPWERRLHLKPPPMQPEVLLQLIEYWSFPMLPWLAQSKVSGLVGRFTNLRNRQGSKYVISKSRSQEMEVTETSTKIPRIIWFMWLQGLDQAPDVVKGCYASWKKYIPNWKIVLLDEHNLEEYVRIREVLGRNVKWISKQSLSDVARINLLARYGGVWVDATCFCCTPLDEWLDEYTGSGFFAFSRPQRDKLLSSWFLASREDCYLTSKWCEEVNLYSSRNHFSVQKNKRVRSILQRILRRTLIRNPSLTRLWFSFVVLEIIKVYPYTWFHYLFTETVRNDRLCREIWNKTKDYSADIPHKLQLSGLLEPIPEEIK
jgi:hypothetical protein